jgi:hypothetical protein
MEVKGRIISRGVATGRVLISKQPLSFYGGVNPENGVVVEKGHELKGKSIKGKVLVFPHGKGSTVGSYTLYRLRKNRAAPKAIINEECEPVVAVGAIISEIPLIDRLEKNPFRFLRNGELVKVDAVKGFVKKK